MPYQFYNSRLHLEDRAVLHQRIEQRFHKMIELGFQEEVENSINEKISILICLLSAVWAIAKCGNIYEVTMIMKKWSSAVFVQLDN